jgi:glycine/D-amino acid oxidase-like deaminating enzyme
LPYIGYLPGNHQNVFCAIGYGGDDIILGTVAAIVICDIITSGNSKYEQLFSPERILKH